ncbi:isocitrate dehydrogenase (NADP(+)) [Candidatus Sumerlaeota bacterium]|nr:isocitrate dehydrogenase (NADP(+)) [Candidatus Sumerlaeota bacterium]
MPEFEKLTPPEGGIIEKKRKKMKVPDNPIIPFIRGDGTGIDIWPAAQKVMDGAVEKAFGGRKRIVWFQIYAGEQANELYGTHLPEDTLKAIEKYVVAIKGPLTTPVGGGWRSLNVTMRQKLDLYACVRPVRYYRGVPSPVRQPQKLDVVIFRENTEDVYAGIEYKQGTPEAERVITFFNEVMGCEVRPDSGVGLKPISIFGTKRLVRKALNYAIQNRKRSVTLVHKGNIMKFTEGAFRDWGYEVSRDEFGRYIVTEEQVQSEYEGKAPAGKIIVKDRIADSMFQQVLLRPDEYSVIALPNLNGDYLSDACAAQVGGLGMAPGANIGDYTALFEATHGTAPKYAGKNMVNPGSLILSGAMMLEYLGWKRAARLIHRALQRTIRQKYVTYDLHRQMKGATLAGTSEFADRIVATMEG